MEKESFVLRVCDFVTKYSIYALVFLVPIFFLPQTTDVLDFNKQSLLLLLVFVSLFATMIKILILGKFEINKSFIHIVAGSLFLVYLLATIFSVYRYGSFWGVPQQASESMLTVICLLLFYFLVSNTFSRKDILMSSIILSFSAIVAELVGVLQLFGLFVLPFDFAKSVSFNMVGSVGSLGILAAVLFPLAVVLLIIVKKWWRILFVLQIILTGMLLLLINYTIIWWVVIIGSALILMLGIIKRNFFDGRWMALPMFFLAVSLFFVLLHPQVNWVPQKTNEIFLSQKTGLNIAMQAIKEKPILGSGLGTFSYDFSKFKSQDFSKSSLWNIIFNKSSSKVLNSLATTGALGFLAILALMAFPIFYGIKFLILKNDSGNEESASQIYSILLLGLAVVLAGQSIAYFLYNSNMALDFVYFFAIAALVGLIPGNRQEYVLRPSSMLTLTVTFIFTLVFIFGIGLLILNGQRYSAEVNYYKGLASYQSGQKADGLKNFESAASLNPESDIYFRQLSQAYLLSLQDELQNTKATPSDAEKNKIQTLVSNSINAAKRAAGLNPDDANNWSLLGYVYQNLLSVSSDASEQAISSYDSALKLDPNNPYLFAQEGNVYLADATSDQVVSYDQKNQLLLQARDRLEKAIALNPNYSNALYSLGIVYDSLSQENKAIDTFTKLQQLNPTNTDIPKILSNLKAGSSALQVATPPVENPPSGTNATIENPPVKESPSSAKTTPKTK